MVAFKEVPGPSAAASEPVLTPEAAQRQIAETMEAVRDNPRHPYVDTTSPLHRYAVQDFQRLHEIAFPEPSTESPAAQEIPNVEDLPAAPTVPGWQWDQEARGEYHSAAAKLGMPQWERVHWEEQYARSLQKPLTDAELSRGRETAEAVLRQMWGKTFEDNVQAARRAVKLFPEAVQDALDRGLGNDVRLILRAAELGRKIPRGR